MIDTICDFTELIVSEPSCYGVLNATMKVTIGPFKKGRRYHSLWLQEDNEGSTGWVLTFHNKAGDEVEKHPVRVVSAVDE